MFLVHKSFPDKIKILQLLENFFCPSENILMPQSNILIHSDDIFCIDFRFCELSQS